MCVAEMLAELAKREKEAGIFPDVDVDAYMKVGLQSPKSTSVFAPEEQASSFVNSRLCF